MVTNNYFSHSYNSKININRKLVVKLSTDHEIKWLDACIKANKFISENKISNNNEFVLPKYWHVKVTEENAEILSNWKGAELSPGQITGISKYRNNKPIKGHNPGHIIKSNINSYDFGIEITFEQFQKYVLDKNETDVKEDNKLPDKWCIKITEENYKVVTDYFNEQADTVCYDKNWIGHYLHRYNKANEDIMRKGNLGTSFTESSPRNNYIEISFKQFKYYIRSGKKNPFPTLIKGGVYTDNLGNPFRFSHIDHNNQRVYVYCDPNFTDTILPNCFYTSLYSILLNH